VRKKAAILSGDKEKIGIRKARAFVQKRLANAAPSQDAEGAQRRMQRSHEIGFYALISKV